MHVNEAALLKWMQDQGEDAMSKLMGATGLSFYTLDKMIRGKYASTPTKPTRMALCSATGLSAEILFPKVEKQEAS